jgi:hypothetical protein
MSDQTQLKCAWVQYDAALAAVQRWHYSRSLPVGKLVAIGVWEDDRFIGVVIYSRGANRHIGAPYALKQTQVCELTRVALNNHVTPVSRIIAITLKMLRRLCGGLKLVVSYADADHGHHGGIYQAGGWIFSGLVREGARDGFIVHGRKLHPKTIHARGGKNTLPWVHEHWDPGALEHRSLGRYKYLMPLDKMTRERFGALSKPYPKRAGSADSGTSGLQPEGGGAHPTSALSTHTAVGDEPN